MIRLWKTGILNVPLISSAVVCPRLAFARNYRVGTLFFNDGAMVRKSKRKSKIPIRRYGLNNKSNTLHNFNTARINLASQRLLAIKTNGYSCKSESEGSLSDSYYQNTDAEQIEFLEKAFPDPSKAVLKIYANLAAREKSAKYIVIPEIRPFRDAFTCTFQLKWPETVKVCVEGNSRSEALRACALSVLYYLKKRNALCLNAETCGYEPTEDTIFGNLKSAVAETNLFNTSETARKIAERNGVNISLNEITSDLEKLHICHVRNVDNSNSITNFIGCVQQNFNISHPFDNLNTNHLQNISNMFGPSVNTSQVSSKTKKKKEPKISLLKSWENYINSENILYGRKNKKAKKKQKLIAPQSISKPFLSAPNLSCTQQRGISTTGKLRLRGQPLPSDDTIHHKKPDDKTLKLLKAIHPKSVIHSYYLSLTELLNLESPLVVNYEQKETGKQWTCTYKVTWPEEKTFSKSSISKKDAATKVCTEVIQWLASLKKIDARGKPVVEKQKVDVKVAYRALDLNRTIMENMNEISSIYEDRMIKNLTESLDEVSRLSENIDKSNLNEDIEGLWPTRRTLRQKFRSPEFYSTKEKVKLPISDYKEHIIDTVANNQVVIIKGEPGCGKSTRVPQYILESWGKTGGPNGEPCRIVVTQPRRIAAISLAERVAYERDESVGDTIGYQVRLLNRFSSNTGKILYCTNGILLRRIQSDPFLSDCSHIVIDEAHERDVNTDLLLNLIRYALKLNPHLKLVVMSATIDTDIFKNYFDNAPICHVPGFTYPVKQHFIDNCSTIDYRATLKMCQNPNPNVVVDDVLKTIHHIHKKKPEGAILCFLPGWEDINSISKQLPQTSDMQVFCLHSRLNVKDQKLIFGRPPQGVRKVILATNIAETSVTIDDVVYVIDTGIQKETRFDSRRGVTSLDNCWISRANMHQRKGRAGRCQPGESYHLYSKEKLEELSEYPLPEILRTSLTKIVLDGKVYSNNLNAIEFLGQLISPPSNEAVHQAVVELTDLELLDGNENLTPLGKALANFQLEPKLARSMVNSIIFKCVTPIVDIVTLFSEEKELFGGGLYEKDKIRKVKQDFSRTSDHLSLMKLFEKWLEYIENEDEERARRFCMANNLVEGKLHTLRQLRQIHFDYLYKFLKDVLPISDDFSDNDELVKAVLLSGVGTLLEHFEKTTGNKKKNQLLTRNNHIASIGSESVNSRRAQYPSNYLVYINETLSNVRRTTMIRETSLVSILAVLLFKNNDIIIKEISQNEFSKDIVSSDQVLLTLDKTKINYICDRRQAQAILKCKEALRAGWQYYIFQLTKGGEYNSHINKDWKSILGLLSKMLEEVEV